MRKVLLLVASVLLVAGSLTATLGTVNLRDFELRGYVDPTKEQNIPFIEPRMGVNVELLQYDQNELRTQLDLISKSGFRWIRQFAYWDDIEKTQGAFDWVAWDTLATALEDFPGLELVAVLMNSPQWARESRGQGTLSASAPPRDIAAFAAFASAFASRYGAWIDYYQIWDEPNLSDAWGSLDPRPADYVSLLAEAAQAIRLADSSATIVAASLAPTTETGGRNISDIRYLEALYKVGAGEIMDVVAGKPYGFSHSPLDRRVDEQILNYSRIVALREIMNAHGDAKKRLWASNYGWNALPLDWPGNPSIWGAVTESERTQYTLQALDRAHREWPWLGAMFLHHWQPAAPADDAQWGFALLRQNGAPSPLLLALQDYPLPEIAQNGLYHAVNDYARYSGAWEIGELGADIGRQQPSDSQLEFDFFGTDLAMFLREDDYVAFLYPTVDGQAANATQRDSSDNAYIFLRSNSRGPETNLVPLAVNLPLAQHTLQVAADRGWDRWAIAGFAVSSGDLSLPYERQITLGVIATCLSLLVLAHSVISAPWRERMPSLGFFTTGFSALLHLVLTGVTSVFMMLSLLWTWDSSRASWLVRDDVNILLALLSGGLLYLSPNLIISALLAFGLFLLVYHRLENGLILTLLWAPFFLYPVELYTYAFPMVEVMMLITAAAGFCRFAAYLGRQLQMNNAGFPVVSRRLLSSLHPMDLAVAVIALLGVISLLWAKHPEVARTELRTLIFEPFLFYVVLRATCPNRQTLLQLFAALAVAGVIVALIGMFVYFSQQGSFFSAEYGFRRLDSVYGSANNAGLLFGRVIPIALAFFIADLNRRIRLLAGIALVCMLPALALTFSTGAILIGVPAGVITVLVAAYRRRALAYISGVGAIAIAAFGLLTRFSDRLANVFDFTSGTTFVRLRLWQSAMAMLRDHPLTGIGLDQFLYLFGGEYLKPDAIWDRDLSHPHNFFLDFWTRLGFLGMIAFFIIQAMFWRIVVQLLKRFRDGDQFMFAMVLGLSGSMAGLLGHGLIDNSVFVIDLAFIFMFQLAAAVCLSELAEQHR
ncbi:MAG: O-antigen ligase [Chloroflexi bacterium]|nr:O-antigen ligase [Chloroflexota bacterium]